MKDNNKIVRLTTKEQREYSKMFATLHDEAIDFATEIRGMIHGSGILKRGHTEISTPVVAVMGLTMIAVEIMINMMANKDGSELDKTEINKLLHDMVDTVCAIKDQPR